MAGNDTIMLDQAIDWHVRQPMLTEAEWATFIAWLEVPAHTAAYDRVAVTDRLLGDAAQPATPATFAPANDDVAPAYSPARPRRWGWSIGGVAVAAGLALLAMPLVRAPAAQPYWLETKAGERGQVAFADGTRIELNGDTRLGLDRADPRVARLERGEAVFHVGHDAARPFTVRSGDLTIQDVGTVFDVTRAGARLDVAVAEGKVLFDPAGQAIGLVAGQALSAHDDGRRIVRSTIDTDLVGGWRGGRLAFTSEPLPVVIAAIERRYGTAVALESGLSGQTFTGMVTMSGSADRDIPHLATLIGAGWRRQGDQWILAPRKTPAP